MGRAGRRHTAIGVVQVRAKLKLASLPNIGPELHVIEPWPRGVRALDYPKWLSPPRSRFSLKIQFE